MSEKTRIKISSAVGAFVNTGVIPEEKLRGLAAAAGMPAVDQVTLLFCLMRDPDSRVKLAASAAFTTLPAEPILNFIASPDAHPAILDSIARFHYTNMEVAAALMGSNQISVQASQYLSKMALEEQLDVVENIPQNLIAAEIDDADESVPEEDYVDQGAVAAGVEGDSETEKGEEFLSKYKLAQQMGISEKIKMALTGDKEWRAILIKDANKLVSCGVIRNPRITDGEVLTILKVGVQNDEIIRLICANREWVKNFKIRKALVDNPKTPLPNALRYLASMGEKDVAAYAKSKNVSSVISTQAKRMLLAKNR